MYYVRRRQLCRIVKQDSIWCKPAISFVIHSLKAAPAARVLAGYRHKLWRDKRDKDLTMAGKAEKEQELIRKFNTLRSEQQTIANKITELEGELSEHRYDC